MQDYTDIFCHFYLTLIVILFVEWTVR